LFFYLDHFDYRYYRYYLTRGNYGDHIHDCFQCYNRQWGL